LTPVMAPFGARCDAARPDPPKASAMLKLLEGFPDDVIAVTARGRVTGADYDKVMIPAVERALRGHDKVRCYYELGREFEAFDLKSAWKDFVIGVEHLPRWERMAVVTDVEWIRYAMRAFGFVMPGELRVFATGQASEARDWIAETAAA